MADNRPVYLNLASKTELDAIDELGGRAETVIAQRPYGDWSDLRRAGLSDEEIGRLKSAGLELGAPGEGPIGEADSGGSADSPSGNLGRRHR